MYHKLLILACLCLQVNVIQSQTYERPPAFAKKVYDDLYRAMDDNHTLKPRLVLSLDPKEIATRIPSNEQGESVVVIGQGLIDLIRNFGKDSMNALAHVLGHEMAHVFKHQNDLKMVGSGYASVDLKKQLKNLNDSLSFLVMERQADEFASFYCHVAGYKTLHVGAAVLDSIYIRFKLKDSKLKKYPPLLERKEIVKNSHEKMKALKIMFDDGVLALVSGEYAAAQQFFRTILKYQYTSREIYNNLGVSYLMDAIDDLDSLEYPYLFPLQIDIHTKLDQITERSLNDDTRYKLEQALNCFEKATFNSKDYAIGYVNKGIVAFLLEDYEVMFTSLESAEKLYDPYVEYSVNILKAIHLDRTGKKKDALKMLSNISEKSDLARRNYEVLSGKMMPRGTNNSEVTSITGLATEWPVPVFGKEQMAEGRRLIEALGDSSQSGTNLMIWDTGTFEAKRWKINKAMVDIYQKKEVLNISAEDWNKLTKSSDKYYKFGNNEYVVFGDLVLKKGMESSVLYRVK